MAGNGQTHLRAALISRRKKLMSISEYSGIGVQALDSYSRGEVQLAPAALGNLTKALFGASASYDPREDAIMLTGGHQPADGRKPQHGMF
jgi:hypothetical protein